MSCLPSAIRARIIASITTKEAQLIVANAAYDAALSSADVEGYELDTKEGRQRTSLRSPSVISKEIARLESELERLYRRLEGGGLVNLNLRRRRTL